MSRVLVTGGAGFLGSAVTAKLSTDSRVERLVTGDLRPPAHMPSHAIFCELDVTDAEALAPILREHDIDTVVHLAAIVNPGADVAAEYRVDVTGTANVLKACIAANVRHIVISSSGAAYGYHADNPAWISEETPLRGNDAFSYSRHKRLVEEMLADYRLTHPDLVQTIFRIGTILGPEVHNQITKLWESKRLLRIAGTDSPFVFIWIDDVAEVFARAAVADADQADANQPAGAFNVAGDGCVTLPDIARRLGKRTLTLPAWLLRAGLAVGHLLRLTPHGPSHLPFLQYRPVLANDRLKAEFGYTPQYTSAQAFERFAAARFD